MNLEIHTKSEDKRRLLEALGKTYAKMLKINNRNGNVFISTKRDVRSGHDADGLTLGLEKDIFIFIQSTLGFADTARVLAHEMVHAKQYLLGHIKHKEHRGRYYTYWMGKLNKNDYLNQPWEVAAYSQESILMHKALNTLAKRKK
jgi:hypothetical protein